MGFDRATQDGYKRRFLRSGLGLAQTDAVIAQYGLHRFPQPDDKHGLVEALIKLATLQHQRRGDFAGLRYQVNILPRISKAVAIDRLTR